MTIRDSAKDADADLVDEGARTERGLVSTKPNVLELTGY